ARPEFHPGHPLGCHRRRVSDRIVFDKMLQLLRFGCSYEAIADTTCSATTIRSRRDEWIQLGVFARLKQIALECYDRTVGLVLDQIAVDAAITKAPGGGEAAGRSPVDRGKQGLKRSGMTDGYGIPLRRVAQKGEKAPIQAGRRWHVERTHAWQNAFHRLARCYERHVSVIDAYFDLADTIITVRSLIRRAWTTYRWDERPNRRP
ncbi:IS5/IS1182 family transposase, partial [Streptomyces sp. NPDC059837]|uniref:IS5/IS1182 family transposase n=1 Tax=Streptomyces sp. NPDC059837 TaxID=3346968 RepID=UPI00364AAC5C